MDQTQKTVSPSDILTALGQCRKGAIIWALVLALVCALGGLVWGGLQMADTATGEEALAAYQLAMDRYETQYNALEAQQDALTEDIGQQRQYLDESLLMALDAYDFYEGSIALQLHTDYQILPGMTYQDPDPTAALRTAYADSLASGELLQAMAQAVSQDVRYMAELLVISPTDRGMTVDVRYADARGAQLLLEQVKAHLEGQTARISGTVAEHTAQVTDLGVARRMDAALAAAQQARGDKLTETVKTLSTVRTRQSDLVKPTPGIHSWEAVGKRILLLTLFGAVLGAGLYLGWKLWIYSGGSRLMSGAQLKEMGIKPWGLDQGQYTAADLAARLPKGGILLLTGSLPSERRKELAQMLAMPETQILCVDGITCKTEALEALQGCDCVLLAERRYATPCAAVQEEKQRIEDYGKELLGCLLLDGDKA